VSDRFDAARFDHQRPAIVDEDHADRRVHSEDVRHRSAVSDGVITESVEEIDRRLAHLASTHPYHLRSKATWWASWSQARRARPGRRGA
jgi:hypothetical protein